MDRALLQQHLALAERHVVDSQQTVARQREIVAQHDRDGPDPAAQDARRLLAQFEELLAIQIADRDRLRKELGLAWLRRG